jgi:hypothetical protein
MELFKNFDRDKWLYNGLIVTFIVLYGVTAFVSFYHAIIFFNIANAIWLSVLLSFVAEIGQASVLFSILLSKENKGKFLSWGIMAVLTSLQIIGNVDSSFNWIITHNDAGLDSFKRSILFFVQAENNEMFRVIVAWISGALLPVIALSMTGLVAQNINIKEEKKKKLEQENNPISGFTPTDQLIDARDIISEVSRIRPTEDDLARLENLLHIKKPETEILKKEEGSTTPNHIDNKVKANFSDTELKSLIKESSTDIKPPEVYVSDKNIEEFDTDDFNEFDEDDEFGPIDFSNEVPDQISPENIKTITKEEAKETLPEFHITNNNGLAESVIIAEPQAEEKPQEPDETPPIIELEKKPDETPEIQNPVVPPPLPRNEHFTPERLEKIRQIARDNLKKK